MPTLSADLAARLDRFAIETPSWGYANSGTRFGVFRQDAAAVTLEDKLDDAQQVHKVTGCCPSVAVHVLWDFDVSRDPTQAGRETVKLAQERGLAVGAINPNVFQDPQYKFGSLAHHDPAVRQQALDHIIYSCKLGAATGSTLLSLWFADGTNYPGQASIVQRKRWFEEGLKAGYAAMPAGMTMLVEYKPFEPAFYHTDIADWGMAAAFARKCGDRAKVLVDTGHHLPGCNIEHIVAFLIDENMLGGFHFNDRKYADDDLTMGSIDPYQLFRIFVEIVTAEHARGEVLDIAYMVDQSHNLKPKVEAMVQTAVVAQEVFTKALLVDQKKLADARGRGDIVAAERCLTDAFWTDVRPVLADYRRAKKLPEDPVEAHRQSGYVERVGQQRASRG